MHIAIVTSEFGENAGGLSYSCSKFSKILQNLGYEITIIPSIDLDQKEVEGDNVSILRSEVILSSGGYRKDLVTHLFFRGHLQNMWKECQNEKFDYVVSFGAGLNGLFASELSRKLNVKLIVLLRGSEVNLSVSDDRLYIHNYHCLKNSSKVIALSYELLERAKDIYYNPKIEYSVIPLSVNVSTETKFLNINKHEFLLGCGARNLNEKKGISNLIKMVFYLNKGSDKKFKIEFAGRIDPDLMENFVKLINGYDLVDSVIFTGELARDSFIEKMSRWDFYVQGSFGEGFSNSVADYLSFGKPFLISDSGFVAETIKSTTNEVVFDDFVPKNMALKVQKLIENPLANELYQAVYKSIYKSTNSRDIISSWQKVFESPSNKSINPIRMPQNILTVVFHEVSKEENSNINTHVKVFHDFVNLVYDKGFKLCSAKNYLLSNEKSNLIICTFDDAYSGILEFALPILNRYGFTATVFVCYDYIGKSNDWNLKDTKKRTHLNKSELQALQNDGWEIGSHGLTHRSLLKLSYNELHNEIIMSKKNLEEFFAEIISYSYPYGDYNDYCKILVEKTYKSAFALSKGGTLNGVDNHQIRRYFISEIINSL